MGAGGADAAGEAAGEAAPQRVTLRERVEEAFALFANAEGTVRAADLELVLKQLGHHLTSAEAHAAAHAIGLEAGTAATVTLPRLLHLLTDGAAALEAGTIALGGTLAAVPPSPRVAPPLAGTAASDPFSAWLYGHGELAPPAREPAVGAAWIYA